MKPLSFRPGDFGQLRKFPLNWRWMLADEDGFPPEVETTVRPLRPDAAKRVQRVVAPLIESGALRRGAFSRTLSFSSDDRAATVRWLGRTGAESTDEVVILWSEFLGVLVTWPLFRFRWSEFCHSAPASVLIYPVSQHWLLVYRRFDRFEMGFLEHAGEDGRGVRPSA